MEAGGDPPTMLLHVLIGELERAGFEVAVDDMSSEVWGRFPAELVDLVLRHLPLKSKHKFRCVSKDWQRILTAYGRLPMLCGVSFEWPSNDLGAASVLGGVSVRPTGVQGTPIRVDLSFLPTKFRRWLSTGCATDRAFVVVSEVQRARALLCVFNPMTRSWRELPPLEYENLHRLDRASVHVTRYGGVDRMEVFVVCSRSGEFASQPVLAGFSSQSGVWRVCTGVRLTRMDSLELGRGTAVQREGDSVLVFYLDGAYGTRFVKIRLPEQVIGSSEILHTCHQENAYLVVVPHSNYRTAAIWKMATVQEFSDINPWQQVSVIPGELLTGERLSLDEVKVAGNYICVISQHRVYAYSIPDGTWQVIETPAGFSRTLLVPATDIVI